MPSPNLTTLPVEILIQIASYLDTPNYQAFRLTCRGIEDSLFRAFAQQYFRKIQFMRTEYSLQALVDISKSRLSSYLRHVVITTHLLGPRSPSARPRPWSIESDTREEKYSRMCDDQAVFLSIGYDQDMLVEAFRNLKLEVVGIHTQPSHYPYHGPSSYGISHIERETSINIRHETTFPAETDRRTKHAGCVQNVLIALGKSGSAPKRFEVDMYNSKFGDDAFNIPPFMEKAVSPVLSNLEAVYVRFHPYAALTKRLIAPQGQSPSKIETYHLRIFLSWLTQAKHLHIQSPRQPQRFFEWFAAPVSNEDYDGPPGLEPPRSPALPMLYELEISQVELHSFHLLAIVKKFSATLRKLSLSKSLLITCDSGATHVYNAWPGFIAQFSRVGSCLTELFLNEIDVGIGRGLAAMRFKDGSYSFSYTGPDMKTVLGDLATSVHLEADSSEPEDGDEDWSGSEYENGLVDFDFEDFVDEYDDLLDEIDQDLNDDMNEDFMIETFFGLGQ
ncbi:hypothetical protein K449DRAFT_384401 [Hypoxylon sp. EC38]|nr:hypothetical protein K449DRAFT_384401 [Hypoxylon sp. EC38]